MAFDFHFCKHLSFFCIRRHLDRFDCILDRNAMCSADDKRQDKQFLLGSHKHIRVFLCRLAEQILWRCRAQHAFFPSYDCPGDLLLEKELC